MNALELKNVTLRQGNFVLDDLNLALPEGCILGLIGENGAGKTTTIRLLLGLCAPDAGQAALLNVDSRSKEFARARQDVGVVLDEACFPAAFHLKQVDIMMGGIYGGWSSDIFWNLTKRLGLDGSKPFKDYSRGMKMKLSIASALSHNAKLLVLDEPTSGLDPIARDDILDLLLEFTRDEKRSVLISSHIVTDLEKLCDYVAFLHEGRLRFFEEKDALREEYAMAVLSPEAFAQLDKNLVEGARRGKYQVEALIRREYAPEGLRLERAGIEDIMLMMTRGENHEGAAL